MTHGRDNKQGRRWHDRGATLVEYSLVFTFLVVIAVTGAKAITSRSEVAVDDQVDCVSKRPPPVSCQNLAPSATTTTTLPPPTTRPGPTTATTAPGSTTTTRAIPTTTLAPAVGVLAATKLSSPAIGAKLDIVVRSGSSPVSGALVRVTATFSYPAPQTGTDVVPFFCTTNAAGSCSVTASAPFLDAKAVQFKVVGIDSTPAASAMPADPAPIALP